MSEQLENFINSEVFRTKMEKMTRRTVEEVLQYETKTRNTEIERAIEKTIETTLIRLGVNVEDSEEVRKDFNHVRSSRLGCELIKRNSLKALITVTIPTIFYFIISSVFEKATTLIK